ncbi:hypothetical protein GF415_00865 [Candidatus Micrarchaeota archaeon]|nr:hypothetical protein [Candidatus Micrarchaeota archaeon]
MHKVTLTHIGAVSLGRLLAVWTFVIGLISLAVYTVVMMLMAILGLASGGDVVTTLIGLVVGFGMGIAGLVVSAIVMFIFGFISAVVYNIILGVGGGIDVDFRERPV